MREAERFEIEVAMRPYFSAFFALSPASTHLASSSPSRRCAHSHQLPRNKYCSLASCLAQVSCMLHVTNLSPVSDSTVLRWSAVSIQCNQPIASFFSQQNHRIDRERPPGWNPSSQHTHAQHREDDAAKHDRVLRRGLIHDVREHTCCEHAEDHPHC